MHGSQIWSHLNTILLISVKSFNNILIFHHKSNSMPFVSVTEFDFIAQSFVSDFKQEFITCTVYTLKSCFSNHM